MKLSLIRVTIILSAVASYVALSGSAHAEEKKSNAAKVHMCESIDVYTGKVDAAHKSNRVSDLCTYVAPKAAQKKIDACASETPETCEVLIAADKVTVLIERKIVVSGVSK